MGYAEAQACMMSLNSAVGMRGGAMGRFIEKPIFHKKEVKDSPLLTDPLLAKPTPAPKKEPEMPVVALKNPKGGPQKYS